MWRFDSFHAVFFDLKGGRQKLRQIHSIVIYSWFFSSSLKENTDFKMYFKTETWFFSICHVVEWIFGAGFVFWHRKCKHYVLNSSLVPFLLCAFIMYSVHFRTLYVLLRCHLRGSVLSQCGVRFAELGLPRGLGTHSPWFPCTFPCPPRVWGWSRSPRQAHSPPSPGLSSPACLSSPPHLILTDKEGSGGATALLLCPAGKWK